MTALRIAVFIVQRGDYEDRHIDGVYATLAAAQRAVEVRCDAHLDHDGFVWEGMEYEAIHDITAPIRYWERRHAQMGACDGDIEEFQIIGGGNRP